MIIIGSRTRNNVMGQVQYPCPRCRQNSFHTIVRSRYWFTLFFIPIIPLNKKSTSQCNTCGFRTAVDNQQADAWFLPPAQQFPPAQPPFPPNRP